MDRITKIVEPKKSERREVVYNTYIKDKKSRTGDKLIIRKVILKYPVNEIVDMMEMQAREAGFEAPLFEVRSGYRSIAQQQVIFNREREKYKQIIINEFIESGMTPEQAAEAATPAVVDRRTREAVALPGKSAHHTGAAIDIDLGFPLKYDKKNIAAMEASPQYQYMRDVLAPFHHMAPYDKEPWHWECDDECIQHYLTNNQKLYFQMKESQKKVDEAIVVEDIGNMLALLEDESDLADTAVFEADQNTSLSLNSTGVKIGIVLASALVVGSILYLRREKS